MASLAELTGNYQEALDELTRRNRRGSLSGLRPTPEEVASVRRPPPPPPEPESDAGFLSDTGNLSLAGLAQLAQGAGYLTGLEGIEDWGREAAQARMQRLSPEMQEALANEFVTYDEEEGYGIGPALTETPLRSIYGALVQSLPATAAGMGVGGAAAMSLGALGRGLAARGIAGGATLARPAVSGAVGFGAGEGLVSAGLAGADVKDFVMNADAELLSQSPRFQEYVNQGMTVTEAREAVADDLSSSAFWKAGATTALLGAPMGAVFGRWIGGAAPETVLRGIGIGAAGEAAQEAAQSAGEDYFTGTAMSEIDPSQAPTVASMANAAVGGALAGGVMGGGLGGVSSYMQRSRRTADLLEAAGVDRVSETADREIVRAADTVVRNQAQAAQQEEQQRQADAGMPQFAVPDVAKWTPGQLVRSQASLTREGRELNPAQQALLDAVQTEIAARQETEDGVQEQVEQVEKVVPEEQAGVRVLSPEAAPDQEVAETADDQEIRQGVQRQEQEGEEPGRTVQVEGAGEETPTPGGILQAPEEVDRGTGTARVESEGRVPGGADTGAPEPPIKPTDATGAVGRPDDTGVDTGGDGGTEATDRALGFVPTHRLADDTPVRATGEPNEFVDERGGLWVDEDAAPIAETAASRQAGRVPEDAGTALQSGRPTLPQEVGQAADRPTDQGRQPRRQGQPDQQPLPTRTEPQPRTSSPARQEPNQSLVASDRAGQLPAADNRTADQATPQPLPDQVDQGGAETPSPAQPATGPRQESASIPTPREPGDAAVAAPDQGIPDTTQPSSLPENEGRDSVAPLTQETIGSALSVDSSPDQLDAAADFLGVTGGRKGGLADHAINRVGSLMGYKQYSKLAGQIKQANVSPTLENVVQFVAERTQQGKTDTKAARERTKASNAAIASARKRVDAGTASDTDQAILTAALQRDTLLQEATDLDARAKEMDAEWERDRAAGKRGRADTLSAFGQGPAGLRGQAKAKRAEAKQKAERIAELASRRKAEPEQTTATETTEQPADLAKRHNVTPQPTEDKARSYGRGRYGKEPFTVVEQDGKFYAVPQDAEVGIAADAPDYALTADELGERTKQRRIADAEQALKAAKDGTEKPNRFTNGAKSKSALVRQRQAELEAVRSEPSRGDVWQAVVDAANSKERPDIPARSVDSLSDRPESADAPSLRQQLIENLESKGYTRQGDVFVAEAPVHTDTDGTTEPETRGDVISAATGQNRGQRTLEESAPGRIEGRQQTQEQRTEAAPAAEAEEVAPDTRYSRAEPARNTDAEYLAAVERGDMEAAQRMVDTAAQDAGYLKGTRLTVGGQGLLNNQVLDRSKLTDDEEFELVEEMDFGLEQPRDVPNTAAFFFTPDGLRDHKRLIKLLKKAATGRVKAEQGYGLPVWESSDGQFAAQVTESAETITRDDNGNVIPLSQRFNPRSDDIRFARGQPSRNTAAAVRAELNLNPRAERALLDSGLVTIVQSASEIPGSHPADVAGAYHQNKIYLVADNIPAGRAEGLILHEIGVHHGLKGMVGDAQYAQIVQTLKRQVKVGSRANAPRAAREAFQAHLRAAADNTIAGNEDALWEETIAYLAESGSNAPVIRRLLAAIRAFMRRLGLVRQFTAADMAHLARGSVQRVVEGMSTDGQPATMYHRVFHGTPHLWQPEPGFPHGRPRLDKMGTGEGHQAYGWGIYLAELQDVADDYRRTLSNSVSWEIDGKVYHGITSRSDATAYNYAASALNRFDGNKKDAIEWLDDFGTEGEARKIIRTAKSIGRSEPAGHLYHLDIPDNVVPRLLDWNKPLSEQTEYVKTALEGNLPEYRIDKHGSLRANGRMVESSGSKEINGQDIYNLIKIAHGDGGVRTGPKFASEYLASIGIPGNRYLDAGSRDGRGNPTHNIVLWDQDVLDRVALLKRNEEALQAIQDAQDDVRYSFAGQRAAAADKHALSAAKQRLEAGADPEAVRQETGWFKGVDGKWRFEIDDSEAALDAARLAAFPTLDDTPALIRGFDGRLSQILQHEKLFAAYPELADMEVSVSVIKGSPEMSGSFDKRTGVINVAGFSEDSALSVLLHEIQHGIQDIEGFAVGGSPRLFSLPDQKLQDALFRVRSTNKAVQTEYRKADEAQAAGNTKKALGHYNIADRLARHKAYEALAGEIEARNVETRRQLTEADRRDLSPARTADVADSEAVVVFDGEEMASAPPPANAQEATQFSRAPATDTAAFRNWFKDSVVTVDGKPGGEPLVVYHGAVDEEGAPAAFTEFTQGDVGGSWFTEDRDHAWNFGDPRDFYLSLKNPVRIDGGDSRFDEGGYSADAELAKVLDQARRDGHDGAVLVNWEGRGRNFIAFRPEQIKSATGNIGTFDPNNPDIRYSRAPADLTPRATLGVSLLARNGGNVNAAKREARALYPGMAEDIGDWIEQNKDRWQEAAEGQADTLYSRTPPTPYEEENARIRGTDKTLWDKAMVKLKRQLAPGGNLPRDVFRTKIERDSEFKVIEVDVRNNIAHLEDAVQAVYGQSLNKLPDETKRELYDAIAKKVPSDMDDRLKEEIYKIKGHVSRLSTEYTKLIARDIEKLLAEGKDEAAAVKVDLLNTIQSHIGEYLHRSYQAFDDPKWAERVPDNVINDARDYILAEYEAKAAKYDDWAAKADKKGNGEKADKHRATAAEWRDKAEVRADKAIELILKEGTAYDTMHAFIRESQLGRKDLTILMKRKEIAPEIRALLGEYIDPRLNYAKTATKLGRLIHNQHFLDKVLELGEGTFLFRDKFDSPLGVTTKIGTGEGYEPLADYYTTPEIKQAFIDALGKNNNEAEWYRKVVQWNGAVKYGLTVLSPTTAVRNWMSALFFTVANGHFDLREAGPAFQAFREYRTNKDRGKFFAYLQRLNELGVVYDTPYAGEMMRLLEESKIEDIIAPRWKQPFRSANNTAQKFYQFGDDFWKIIGYENEKRILAKYREDLTAREIEEMAAERIRNTYPTYSMTGRFLNTLRRFPLAGTFVSFPAEIIRTTSNILWYLKEDMKNPQMRPLAMRRAFGLATAAGFAHGLQAIFMMMLGVDDDEEEAFRVMAAPWQQNSNILPISRDEKGNLMFVDLSYVDPYNYWKRPINAILRDQPFEDELKSAAVDALSPFFGPDIAAGAIFEILTNQTDTGRRVFNPEDTVVKQTGDILTHMATSIQPGFANNLSRMVDAVSGEVSPSGQKRTIPGEMAALLGQRVTTFDPKVALYYNSFEFKDVKTNATNILTSVASDPNPVSDRELRSAFERAMKARERGYEKMHTIIRAAKESGMKRAQIARTLRNSQVSKADIGYLLRGITPPWRPSSGFMSGAMRKSSAIYTPEIRREINHRVRTIANLAREQQYLQ